MTKQQLTNDEALKGYRELTNFALRASIVKKGLLDGHVKEIVRVLGVDPFNLEDTLTSLFDLPSHQVAVDVDVDVDAASKTGGGTDSQEDDSPIKPDLVLQEIPKIGEYPPEAIIVEVPPEKPKRKILNKTKRREYKKPVDDLIREFFENNPDTWFSYDEVAGFTDVLRATISPSISRLVNAGTITKCSVPRQLTLQRGQLIGGRDVVLVALNPTELPSERNVEEAKGRYEPDRFKLSKPLYEQHDALPIDPETGMPILPEDVANLGEHGITIRPGDVLTDEHLKVLAQMRGRNHG